MSQGGDLQVIIPIAINRHSTPAKLRPALDCRGWLTAQLLHHQLPLTLIRHACPTDQSIDACCFLEQSVFSYVLNLLILYFSLKNTAEGCPWKPLLLYTSYAVCCYTSMSDLLLVLIHLEWNSKLVWRRPELFIDNKYKDKSRHEMYLLGVEANVVCKSEWCSCCFVVEMRLNHCERLGIG